MEGWGRDVSGKLTISGSAVDEEVAEANDSSSSRQHTGSNRDWRPDVCTSVHGTPSVVSFAVAGVSGTQNPGDTVTVTGKGTLTLGANGGYTFTPAAN